MIQCNFRARSLVVSNLCLSVCEVGGSATEGLKEIASSFPCCPVNSECS